MESARVLSCPFLEEVISGYNVYTKLSKMETVLEDERDREGGEKARWGERKRERENLVPIFQRPSHTTSTDASLLFLIFIRIYSLYSGDSW
jgi:hypothetical protein